MVWLPGPSAAESFLAGIGVSQGMAICQHVMIGKGYASTIDGACSSTEVQAPDDLVIGRIGCKRGQAKKDPTVCKNGPLCLYLHHKKNLKRLSTSARLWARPGRRGEAEDATRSSGDATLLLNYIPRCGLVFGVWMALRR